MPVETVASLGASRPRAAGAAPAGASKFGLAAAVAWRNLWRNRRRTWLAVGGVAFATALVQFSMSMQVGGYAAQIEAATDFFVGHVQIQRSDYVEQARFEQTINGVMSLVRSLEARPDIRSVAPRVEAFALASVDERSFGVQVLGMDAARERRTVGFLKRINAGRMAAGPDEVVLGSALARNLGAGLGDEVVVLGAGKEGGVAALAASVSGILNSGIVELDRSLMLAPINAVQGAFGLGDEAHTLVVRSADPLAGAELVGALNTELPQGAKARNWDAVLPDLHQGIELDRLGSVFLYGIIIVVVTFSVVNTFIMTVFERTREFGLLRAIGMRPGAIIGMVQLEAFCIWLLGVGVALALMVPIIVWLSSYGLYLGEEISQIETNMFFPDRIHPRLSWAVSLTAPAIMLGGVQLAALAPALRIRRLQPVAALRAQE